MQNFFKLWKTKWGSLRICGEIARGRGWGNSPELERKRTENGEKLVNQSKKVTNLRKIPPPIPKITLWVTCPVWNPTSKKVIFNISSSPLLQITIWILSSCGHIHTKCSKLKFFLFFFFLNKWVFTQIPISRNNVQRRIAQIRKKEKFAAPYDKLFYGNGKFFRSKLLRMKRIS